MTHKYRFPVLASEIYDSLYLSLDLGFGMRTHRKCRLQGLDMPELRGGTTMAKAAGRLARNVARAFVAAGVEDGSAVFVSEKWAGKFGRTLGDVTTTAGSLRDVLIEGCYAVPCDGASKAPLGRLHAQNLRQLIQRGELLLTDVEA